MKNARLVQNLSVDELKALIQAKKKLDKVEPLKKKRDRLLKAAAKIQMKINRLLSGTKAAKMAGRPAGKPGRPRKRRPLSAAARRKIVQAQKARWARFHAAKKAKAAKAEGQ